MSRPPARLPLMARFSGRGIRMVRNALFDLRSGALLAGDVGTSHAEEGAIDVVNTDVTALDRIFMGRIGERDAPVDVGCGKGRVIRWWLRRGVRGPITGLELDEDVAETTRQRLRRHPNVTITTGDAVTNLPADATLFYLHNPFQDQVVRTFSERVKELYSGHTRPTVLYYNPVHAEVFGRDPAWDVEDVTIGGAGFHRLAVLKLR